MLLWRISNYATLDGAGGLYASGRWHNIGSRVVYLSEHPAAALLEIIANTDISLLPDTFKFLKVDIPEDVACLNASITWDNWRDNLTLSRNVGDIWIKEKKSTLFKVPSALSPDTYNYLLNPLHADAAKCEVTQVIDYPLDQRLKRTSPAP